jgi:hypothetical protein
VRQADNLYLCQIFSSQNAARETSQLLGRGCGMDLILTIRRRERRVAAGFSLCRAAMLQACPLFAWFPNAEVEVLLRRGQRFSREREKCDSTEGRRPLAVAEDIVLIIKLERAVRMRWHEHAPQISREQRIEGFEGRRHGCAAGRGQSVEAYGEVERDALVRRKNGPEGTFLFATPSGFHFWRHAVAGAMGREADREAKLIAS